MAASEQDRAEIIDRRVDARALFTGIAPRYEWPATVLSFLQYGRWRRFAVRRLSLQPGARVLDVATGTGLVARDVARTHDAAVIGVDLTPAMLARAGARGIPSVAARAERLPFGDGTFRGLTFSYLLRYVDDPRATVRELVRVLAPGAPMASIEFGVPRGSLTGRLWRLYALGVFPVLAGIVSRGWRRVGVFLGRSILDFSVRHPVPDLEAIWRDAGMTRVRTRALSFGAGIVTWGVKRDG